MPTTQPDAGCWMLDPPSRPRSERRGKGAFNGGAWHPDSQRIGVLRSLSEYEARPRYERRGAKCCGAVTKSISLDRRGTAAQQMAPRRRNPSGAGGLRAQASFRLVDDAEHRLPRHASPAHRKTPARGAHLILGQAPNILSGSATTEGRFESRSAAPESGHGDGDGHGYGGRR